jgi:hypothetical protein
MGRWHCLNVLNPPQDSEDHHKNIRHDEGFPGGSSRRATLKKREHENHDTALSGDNIKSIVA